jgi:hypothetical protein
MGRTIGQYYVSPNDVSVIYCEQRAGRLNYIRLCLTHGRLAILFVEWYLH